MQMHLQQMTFENFVAKGENAHAFVIMFSIINLLKCFQSCLMYIDVYWKELKLQVHSIASFIISE